MKNKNGKHQHAGHDRPRPTEGTRSITIPGPVRDVYGTLHAEALTLFETDTTWQLTMQRVLVQEGGPAPSQLIATPGQAAQPPRMHTIFVPFYEVTQHAPNGRAVQFAVPVEQLRHLRVPLRVVEVEDSAGQKQRQAVPYAIAEQIEAEQRTRLARAEPAIETAES